MTDPNRPCAAFEGWRLLARGPFADVAASVRRRSVDGGLAPLLIFDAATGEVVDLPPDAAPEPAQAETRGRGRPKLGVVAREVTLLPRHWDWLNAQPGGASVALRKLVEGARKAGGASDSERVARDAAYRFMSAIAGDFAGFEEAARALFANDRARFEKILSGWPPDIASHALACAFPEVETAAEASA